MDQGPLPQRDEQFLTDPGGDHAHRTLSHSRSPMIRLGSSANSYSRASTRVFQQNFGRTAMEWRILVTLAQTPGATSSQAVATIGVDKAAVSRTLHSLEQEGLVSVLSPTKSARRKQWVLTDPGKNLHDQMLKVSLAMHHHLLSGFTGAEITQLNGLLNRFKRNLSSLEEALAPTSTQARS